jgi:hypothetical protein
VGVSLCGRRAAQGRWGGIGRGRRRGTWRCAGRARCGPWAPAPHSPVEDQADLVGAADVEVVADDLLEEDPPGHRPVQHLGQGEFGRQDRQLVAVAGGPVGGAKRVRQPGQPLAQQRVDVRRAQSVADRLQRRDVVDRGKAVIQRGEPNARLGGLPFGPLVAV